MTEEEGRAAVVREAMSWIGTPYHSNAMVKGAGTDCAMLLLAVYSDIGLIPRFDPRPYSPTWHIHRNEEMYMRYIMQHSSEFAGPPLPGDVVMFKIGKLFAHGAIVTQWPYVVHALAGAKVTWDDISKNTVGKRALWTVPRRYFTLWAKAGEANV